MSESAFDKRAKWRGLRFHHSIRALIAARTDAFHPQMMGAEAADPLALDEDEEDAEDAAGAAVEGTAAGGAV